LRDFKLVLFDITCPVGLPFMFPRLPSNDVIAFQTCPDRPQDLQFETTNHVRQMLTFGYALWTEPVLTNMILDIESKMVYTSLGPQIGHWDSAWNRCNDLGDGWRLFSQRDVKAGRVVTDIATGYSAYMDTVMSSRFRHARTDHRT
jgi:hypothetical protein